MKTNEMTLSEMVAVYNNLTGQNLKKFRDKKTAVSRFEKAGIVAAHLTTEKVVGENKYVCKAREDSPLYGFHGFGENIDEAERNFVSNCTDNGHKVHILSNEYIVSEFELPEPEPETEEEVEEVEEQEVKVKKSKKLRNFWNHLVGCQADLIDVEVKKFLDSGETKIPVASIMEATNLTSARILNHLNHLLKHKDHKINFEIEKISRKEKS